MKLKFNILIACLAIATAVPVRAQVVGSLAAAPSPVYGYTPVPIQLPNLTIAAQSATNLINGWSTTNISTNIVTTWSASSSAFVNTTNTYTNISTLYAQFDTRGQRFAPLQFEWRSSNPNASKIGVAVARSETGINFDTANPIYFDVAANATNTASANCVILTTNIDMGAFGFGRILYMTNADATAVITNNGSFNAIVPRNGK